MTLTSNAVPLMLLLIVTLQAIVQIPLDLRYRMLSRTVTLFGILTTLAVVGLSVFLNRDWSEIARPLASSMIVVGIYFGIHAVSPKSLGFGDVLLVAPLTLSVAYVGIEQVLHWQLISAASGAIHGVVLRTYRTSSALPFGPHLLIAACIVILIGINDSQ